MTIYKYYKGQRSQLYPGDSLRWGTVTAAHPYFKLFLC